MLGRQCGNPAMPTRKCTASHDMRALHWLGVMKMKEMRVGYTPVDKVGHLLVHDTDPISADCCRVARAVWVSWRSTGSSATWCRPRACAPPTTACWMAGEESYLEVSMLSPLPSRKI